MFAGGKKFFSGGKVGMKGGWKCDNFGGYFQAEIHQPLIHNLVRALVAVISAEINRLSTSYPLVIQFFADQLYILIYFFILFDALTDFDVGVHGGGVVAIADFGADWRVGAL